MRIDTKSETWRAIEAALLEKAEGLRKQLEADQPEAKTAATRAELRAVRGLLTLPATVNAEPFTYG